MGWLTCFIGNLDLQAKKRAKEDAKLARAEEREEKKRLKTFDTVVKAAAKEGRKDNSPSERLKQMLVVLMLLYWKTKASSRSFCPQ